MTTLRNQPSQDLYWALNKTSGMGGRQGRMERRAPGSCFSSENWTAVNASWDGFEDASHQLRWPHLKCRRCGPEGGGGSVFQQRLPLAPSQRAPQAEENIEPERV